MELVTIHFAQSRTEAEVLLALLEGAGVPATSSNLQRYDTLPTIGQGWLRNEGIRIEVAPEREAEARRVVASAREAGREMES